jgi:hypothetical protein
MRPKHHASLALAAWLAVVGWVGSMVVGKPQAFFGAYAETDGAMAAQIQLEIQRAEQVRGALAALASQAALRVPPAGVVAESPPAPEASGSGLAGTGGAAAGAATGANAPQGRTVSMILSGVGLSTRAMIDGRMVGAGARLDDGGIVRSIGPRSVRIEESDGRMTTLALRTPGELPASDGSPGGSP